MSQYELAQKLFEIQYMLGKIPPWKASSFISNMERRSEKYLKNILSSSILEYANAEKVRKIRKSFNYVN